MVGVNTHLANKIVLHGLKNNLIKELQNNYDIKSEVFFNKETRFDFLIENKEGAGKQRGPTFLQTLVD